MNKSRSEKIRRAVEQKYSSIATIGYLGGCCGSIDNTGPSAAREVALSCGSPLKYATLGDGMTALDLGSGGGIDAFAAAKRIGPRGRVIGIDSTAKMVARARRTAQENHYSNVEFRLGDMEKLPVRSGTGDLVISNCAVNLVPNKKRAYTEMYRVLKSGGRLMISDIVSDKPIPTKVRSNLEKWSGCIAGALTSRGLRRILSTVGFVDFEILEKSEWEKGREDGLALSSVTFTAMKP